MKSKSISVVVVNWNRKEMLRECLTSLESQTYTDFEVVVVDNSSIDGSVHMVLTEFIETGKLNCKIIENQENRGFCEANNQGFAASRSDFVALLNNDAAVHPEWLGSLLSVFDDPRVGMAASKILVYEDRTKIDKVGHLIYFDGQNRGRGSGEIDRGQYDQIEEVAWPDGCAAMYRRELLDEVGGFDEDFFAYADDADLGLRGRIAGWNCLYVPHAVVYHRRGTTLGVASTGRLVLIERNRILLAVKLFPWSLLWLNGYYYALRLLSGAWAAVRGKGETVKYAGTSGKFRMAWAMLKGDLKALPLLPRMFARRREIDKFRKLTPSETRQLLLRFRISLKTLNEQAT